jgi:hypothetical protein
MLYRKFDDDGALVLFQFATACSPAVTQYTMPPRYTKAMPPDLHRHNGILVTEWRVREDPTCLACIVVPPKGLT